MTRRKRKAGWQRKLFYFARVIHIYSSALLLALLIVFCVSGLLLNHTEWLDDSYRDGELTRPLPTELELSEAATLLPGSEQLAAIESWLAREFNLPRPASVNVDREFGEISFDYKLPAGFAFAVVLLESNHLRLEYRRGDLWTVLNDLHKGRNTGAVWSWVIDLSAVLMILFACSGMVILLQNKKHRVAALVVLATGILTPFLLYYLWVPRLGGVVQ